MHLTAAVTREDSSDEGGAAIFVARCLEVEVTSQGGTFEESLSNLREALELYLEDAPFQKFEPPIIAQLDVAKCPHPQERHRMDKAAPMLRFMVLIEQGKTGYSAYAPDLPGCIATGKTLAKVESLMHQAIEYHLELMAERGETLPEATHVIATNMSVRDPFSDQESPKPAALLGRKGGAAKSETKAQAARENGRKGGRPRKNQAPSLPSSG